MPAGLIRTGENVLAVEVHNRSGASSDLGFDLTLIELISGGTLAGDSRVRARALSGGEWSALEDETYRVLDPTQNLVISEIMYHPTDPTPADSAAGGS